MEHRRVELYQVRFPYTSVRPDPMPETLSTLVGSECLLPGVWQTPVVQYQCMSTVFDFLGHKGGFYNMSYTNRVNIVYQIYTKYTHKSKNEITRVLGKLQFIGLIIAHPDSYATIHYYRQQWLDVVCCVGPGKKGSRFVHGPFRPFARHSQNPYNRRHLYGDTSKNRFVAWILIRMWMCVHHACNGYSARVSMPYTIRTGTCFLRTNFSCAQCTPSGLRGRHRLYKPACIAVYSRRSGKRETH